ncbi:cytochrome ubiquinol oxidase subunit I [Oecophyllibacter saccharovorans]|uniref:Cytochrome bd-I ubiquinol oxidase subunit CydA n=1 Tax=Oecophyllibacter saccharovorans TaxID=2558360 RepID=A0A506UKH3_9PROT|nr:cytochrome ubiquinol oxidase subunit I [Oecophyllibacter saccharovorans]QDH14969.1 cytochrome bd-I ubiquinol oxidase subunit CydA [Oecophyllibacter saccharovorans]TPW33810.1 cytochrome bd-I ubiquinol oxidase subunit CydA [Oecophyllibacter saccharovorans]TPW35154.1 cytochrome bd-I ubiquinol oxidase subunit CydA [Oecophyllibacter saccharovorans]
MDLINPQVVDLSRFQFALTALYHFMFVPLTLGLTFMLAAIETVYVITGRKIYKEMTQFWGGIFGINFALGVATGLTMEFEFGTNWSMYSHFFGDMFGTPLAIEGLMAFFLEATFVGLMFFGWHRLSKGAHLAVTYLVALGSNLSALWILVANGGMNLPVGGYFDPTTMRLQIDSFADVVFNPDAQAKFVHTSVAGYVCAAMLIMGISAFYILRRRHMELALRSFRMATLFGLLGTCAVIALGDALGVEDYKHQPTKLAAMEGIWNTTHPPEEPWLLFALPDDAQQKNYLEIGIPYVLTPLVTHSFNTPILGMHQLEEMSGPKIRSGIVALSALKTYSETHSADALALFKAHENDLGYGFLAVQHAPNQDVSAITDADVDQVVKATEPDILPNVFVTFWSFRIMVFLGGYFLVFFAFAALFSLKYTLVKHRWFLRLAVLSIPLPVLATEFGWITAEGGRQPWTVFEKLPTFLSSSSHSVGYMIFSLVGFALLYSIFIVIELFLMFRTARLGPQDYHHETAQTENKKGAFGLNFLNGDR